jgi:septal ring factor EnvC (AmiA/AmiB activator)
VFSVFSKIFLGFFIFLLLNSSFPQIVEGQDSEKQSALESIRGELKKYREKLQQQQRKETSALDLLEQVNTEINLLHKFVGQLKREEIGLRGSIIQSNQEILRLQDEFETEKAMYANRIVNYYKHRHLSDLEILLSSKSFNQVLIWLKYSKKIAEADRRRLQNLLERKNEIEQSNKRRREKLAEHERILAEKSEEESKLKSRRGDKEKFLAQIRSDKKLFTQLIEQYNREAKEMQRLVQESEAERLGSPRRPPPGSNFASIKGKMVWPVHGRVITSFGNVRNPELDTSYPYEGIDIQAQFGDEVQAVYPGVVTVITWQRGRGNIVIINHFGGYYTVYTHLSEFLVNVGQEVEMGELVGRVGESGSISGPVLHFEIWEGGTAVNPENWLEKGSKVVIR